MKVLEFAFGSREQGSDYLPHCYPTHCVVYTGTHDNDTIRGWMASAPRKEAAFAKEYLRLSRAGGLPLGHDALGLGLPRRAWPWSRCRTCWAWAAGPG